MILKLILASFSYLLIRLNLKYVPYFDILLISLLIFLDFLFLGSTTIETYGKKYLAKDLTIKDEDKKISFVLDTSLNSKIVPFVKQADLLICESSFGADLKDKAKEYEHLTSEQAAKRLERYDDLISTIENTLSDDVVTAQQQLAIKKQIRKSRKSIPL